QVSAGIRKGHRKFAVSRVGIYTQIRQQNPQMQVFSLISEARIARISSNAGINTPIWAAQHAIRRLEGYPGRLLNLSLSAANIFEGHRFQAFQRTIKFFLCISTQCLFISQGYYCWLSLLVAKTSMLPVQMVITRRPATQL